MCVCIPVTRRLSVRGAVVVRNLELLLPNLRKIGSTTGVVAVARRERDPDLRPSCRSAAASVARTVESTHVPTRPSDSVERSAGLGMDRARVWRSMPWEGSNPGTHEETASRTRKFEDARKKAPELVRCSTDQEHEVGMGMRFVELRERPAARDPHRVQKSKVGTPQLAWERIGDKDMEVEKERS